MLRKSLQDKISAKIQGFLEQNYPNLVFGFEMDEVTQRLSFSLVRQHRETIRSERSQRTSCGGVMARCSQVVA
jgi:hypothetical protein